MAALTPLDGGRIKKSRASFVGGIAVGIGVMVLWTAITRDLAVIGTGPMLLGIAVSLLVALWIWRADL
ncbi:MAG: hypothetical protein JWP04_1038 [Belnapia sp.]|jgi:hypothetical protein|nr:hypothetical protein [Belnapia sp.]